MQSEKPSPYEPPKTNPVEEKEIESLELSGLTMFASVLGVSSVFLVTAPFALVVSMWALRVIREKESRGVAQRGTILCVIAIMFGFCGTVIFCIFIANRYR